MRRAALIVPVLTASLVLSASSAEAYRLKREWVRSFDVPDGVTLFLENTSGAVEIDGWDRDRIEVRARVKVKAPSKSSALKLFEKLKFDVAGSREEVSIRVKNPRIRLTRFLDVFRGDRRSVTVSFKVKVPRRCNVKVRNVNGGVDVSGISGEIDIETKNGSIDVDGEEIFGVARTINGSILFVTRRFPHGADLALKGTNGAIDVRLPRELDAVIDAACINGSVKVSFPFSEGIEAGRRRVKGKVGNGSGSIRLRTVNGAVSVGMVKQVI